MTTAEELLQYILPVLAVFLAVVILCFYHFSKKRRGSYDVTVIPLTIVQPEVNAFYTRVHPRNSTMDLPPPYSLFDPKLTNTCPGAAPPPYEMHPTCLPVAPHLWNSDSASTSHS
ncbi:hypothetical protein WMY93_011065 [Mugilogobius chulae]|uniref:Uncharacterized protein n=1 Tax=Mugilogobius chulae TaxID=88201 RepID=A0AAW0PKK6_9GOBI